MNLMCLCFELIFFIVIFAIFFVYTVCHCYLLFTTLNIQMNHLYDSNATNNGKLSGNSCNHEKKNHWDSLNGKKKNRVIQKREEKKRVANIWKIWMQIPYFVIKELIFFPRKLKKNIFLNHLLHWRVKRWDFFFYEENGHFE